MDDYEIINAQQAINNYNVCNISPECEEFMNEINIAIEKKSKTNPVGMGIQYDSRSGFWQCKDEIKNNLRNRGFYVYDEFVDNGLESFRMIQVKWKLTLFDRLCKYIN
jgi:hypothetical protein